MRRIRILWRLARTRLAPRRTRLGLACAAALAVGLLAMALIPSCRRPPPPVVTLEQIPPVPAGSVRVRLNDAAEAVRIGTTGSYRLLGGPALVAGGAGRMAEQEVRWTGSYWQVGKTGVRASSLRLVSLGDSVVLCDGRGYRGQLLLRPADGQRFVVDNHVPLEAYLAGVLARELPRLWHEEAYKAQAVAARTYVLYEMRHGGRTRDYDVHDDQRSQVYGGVVDETPKSIAAVLDTAGQVLVVGPAGVEHIFKAYYSSTCGGVTNPAEGLEAQDQQVAPLGGGVVCNDCSRAGRYRWAAVLLSKPAIYAALATAYPKLAALGSLEQVRLLSTTPWGRPQWLELVGTGGRNERLRADDFRLALLRHGPPEAKSLYSMNCTVREAGAQFSFENGRGFGHGVGLCQYGAQGKALRGLKYHEILYAYYPGARIARINP